MFEEALVVLDVSGCSVTPKPKLLVAGFQLEEVAGIKALLFEEQQLEKDGKYEAAQLLEEQQLKPKQATSLHS